MKLNEILIILGINEIAEGSGLENPSSKRTLHVVWTSQRKRSRVVFTASCQLLMLITFTDWCGTASWPHVDFNFPCAWSLLFPFRTVAFRLHPIIYEPRIDYAVLYKNNGICVLCWLCKLTTNLVHVNHSVTNEVTQIIIENFIVCFVHG